MNEGYKVGSCSESQGTEWSHTRQGRRQQPEEVPFLLFINEFKLFSGAFEMEVRAEVKVHMIAMNLPCSCHSGNSLRQPDEASGLYFKEITEHYSYSKVATVVTRTHLFFGNSWETQTDAFAFSAHLMSAIPQTLPPSWIQGVRVSVLIAAGGLLFHFLKFALYSCSRSYIYIINHIYTI